MLAWFSQKQMEQDIGIERIIEDFLKNANLFNFINPN